MSWRQPTGRGGRAGLPLALLQGRLPIKLPLLLEEEVTLAMANAAEPGVGLGMACFLVP